MTISLADFKSAELVEELERRGVIPHNHDFLYRLREQNLFRMPRFSGPHTPGPGSWGPMQWGCCIAGEVGEACNELKKLERQMPGDPSPDETTAKFGNELADVFIYGDLAAAYFALDLRRIISHKFNLTSKKFGFPERL